MKDSRQAPRPLSFAASFVFMAYVLGAAHAFAEVDVLPLPLEMVPFVNLAGRAIADKANDRLFKANQQFDAAVGKYTSGELFGFTGKLSPSADISFVRAGLCVCDGHNGAVMEFSVHARAKIDVGSHKLFGIRIHRELWGVDTVQLVQVVVLPKKRDDRKMVAVVDGEVVSATATKERGARQRHADAFRDAVRLIIEAGIDQYSGEHDLAGWVGKLMPRAQTQAAD